jgi:hypothetical protein
MMTSEMIEKAIREDRLELVSTQKRLCVPIIKRICKKMLVGIRFPPISIENGLICDGHHRYVASILANYALEKVKGNTTSATVAVSWSLVVFEGEDWDTEAKIAMLNHQDAEFNGIAIGEIVELLKQP